MGSQCFQPPPPLADVSALIDILSPSAKNPVAVLDGPIAQTYLSRLTELSLHDVLSEPERLHAQSQQLTTSITSLTHTSYATFLSLHQDTTALTCSLASISSSLESLLSSSLPVLEQSIGGWKTSTDILLKERSKARVVLEQHEKMRELLEIPLLIDACARNGYFSEALSLALHVRSLTSGPMHGASSSSPLLIISSVLEEVHYSIMLMLASLLKTLYEPNGKLLFLWKAVNFLRKVDVFGPSSPFLTSADGFDELEGVYAVKKTSSGDEQIALVFLVGRESCLKAVLEPRERDIVQLLNHETLDDGEREDLANCLKRYIDAWREGVYDIMSQFSAIFLDPHPTFAQQPKSPSLRLNPVTSDLHILLTTYATRALTSYLLPIISSALPLLSLSLLPSLLTQMTYCSTAFARVGLDFRGVLAGIFPRTVLNMVLGEMRSVHSKWDAILIGAMASDTNIRGSKRAPRDPTKWLATPNLATSPPLPQSSTSISKTVSSSSIHLPGPAHIPLPILAFYPPLAEHTNLLLGVLNGLRMVAPLSIFPELVVGLDDEILAPGGESLVAYVRAVHSFNYSANINVVSSGASRATTENGSMPVDRMTGLDRLTVVEKEIRGAARAAGEVYFKVLVPFVRRALVEGVYGHQMYEGHEWEVEQGGRLENIIASWDEWVGQLDGES